MKYIAIGTNTAFAIHMWKHIIKITNQEANKNASKHVVESSPQWSSYAQNN